MILRCASVCFPLISCFIGKKVGMEVALMPFVQALRLAASWSVTYQVVVPAASASSVVMVASGFSIGLNLGCLE